ncbi:MAG TPA: acetyl-CoA hydrolase/transferase C-terminal domain-containing protein, partial [Puia sp.]|nr:acetyl-CoA hydrolase/transferase C-terminal domain-containing protein [Puia sp.]
LPIIAMPSVTSTGISRIVPVLKEGAGVVTTRGHVHWVATEYGRVNLFGKNLKQRAQLLINIAHPAHREWLDRAFYQRYRHTTTAVAAHPEPKPEPAAGL